MVGAVVGGDRRQQGGGDDARDGQAIGAGGHLGEQPLPEKGAHLVAGQLSWRSVGLAYETATRSASGSTARPSWAPVAVIRAARRAVAPGSSGFGNETVGKSGSGCSCSAPGGRHRWPASASSAGEERSSDPVHRAGGDPDRSGGGRDPSEGRRDVVVEHRGTHRLDARTSARQEDRLVGRDCVDGRGDLGVGGRDDLGGVVEVELEAVVGGWVVAGRDHDPCGAAESADREDADRGGGRPAREPHRDAVGGKHLGAVGGEALGAVARVVGHDDAGFGRVVGQEPPGDAGGRLANHQSVHAGGPCAHLGPEPGGAERETTVEALRNGIRVARGEERLDLCARLGSGSRAIQARAAAVGSAPIRVRR